MSKSRALKIAYNIDFLPSKLGTGFKKWEENGHQDGVKSIL